MKKLILILMLGSLFAKSEQLSINDNLYLLNGESFAGKYIASDDDFIIFMPEGYPAEQSINKSIVNRVVLADGTIIYDIKIDSFKYETGKHLIDFSRKFYTGIYLSLLGQGIIIAGVINFSAPIMYIGSGVTIAGSIMSLISFKDIGEAGEELIVSYEKEHSED